MSFKPITSLKDNCVLSYYENSTCKCCVIINLFSVIIKLRHVRTVPHKHISRDLNGVDEVCSLAAVDISQPLLCLVILFQLFVLVPSLIQITKKYIRVPTQNMCNAKLVRYKLLNKSSSYSTLI